MAAPMADKEDSSFPALGCLIAAGVAVALLGALLVTGMILGPRAEERLRAAEAARQFNEAKRRSSAHVIMEAAPINMLAEDKESVEALNELYLSSIDFRDADMTSAGKLVNVRKVYIYSCSHPEDFLRALKRSQAIEELCFDTTVLDGDEFQLLETFPSLKKVYFSYIADKNRVDQLRAAIPDVVVEVDETD